MSLLIPAIVSITLEDDVPRLTIEAALIYSR